MRFGLLLALGLTWLVNGSHAAEPTSDRCVVLVSIDGLANFYLDDPRADLPTLRRLIKNGARAEGTICAFPTVTWPNHTTLVTGVAPARHGVIGNNYLDRKSGSPVPFIPDPLFDKDQIVKVPTVYDAADKAGLVTAGIVWPATRNARSLHWTVPDMGGPEAWPQYGTQVWLQELRHAGIPVDSHGTWTGQPTGGVQRDWLYTRMARHLFENHPPNLLMIHLVEVDHVEHRYGPRSPEAYWAVSYADDRLRDLVEAVEASPYKDKTTFVVVSDHGFFPIEQEIWPNVLLQQEGLLAASTAKSSEKNPADKQAVAVSQGGACMVYVLNDAKRTEIIKRLRDAFAKVEGIDAVYTAEEFDKLGQATPEVDPKSPDLWLAAKSGYSFANTQEGSEVVVRRPSPGGTHGYLPNQSEMLGTLVISGYGIKPGTRIEKTSSINVAPTIAKLLGIELPTADGKPLDQVLIPAK